MKVNLPPFIKTPKEFLADKEKRTYFEQLEFTLFQMWKKMGGSSDIIAEANQYQAKNQAQLNDIMARIGSGDALTSDETGFTVDLTTLTVDMVEA